jgi:hypothetical protein
MRITVRSHEVHDLDMRAADVLDQVTQYGKAGDDLYPVGGGRRTGKTGRGEQCAKEDRDFQDDCRSSDHCDENDGSQNAGAGLLRASLSRMKVVK